MAHTIPVEDPIHSLFELADQATREAPMVRSAYRHSQFVVAFIGLCLFFGAIATLYYGIVQNHAILAGFGFLVIVLIYLSYVFYVLRRSDDLIEQFFSKLRAIDAVERTEAEAKVPPGSNPIERYAKHVWKGDATWDPALRGAVATTLGPRSWVVQGHPVYFDLAAEKRGSLLFRLTGLGDPGVLFLVRLVPSGISLAAFDSMAADAQALASLGNSLPTRLVLLRSSSEPLTDDVYTRVTRHRVPLRYRFAHAETPLQVVSERSDGVYDFTPYLVNLS